MNENPLGRATEIPTKVAPEILYPIKRSTARDKSGIKEPFLFLGQDVWNCYELSWLDLNGKPVAATCRISYDCHSSAIVESKSLKLYLYSFNMERFTSTDQVAQTITRDLRLVIQSDSVEVVVYPLIQHTDLIASHTTGICIDELPATSTVYTPDAKLLFIDQEKVAVSELLYSNVFRSLCPVTAQPDWGTITVQYQGTRINHQSLLSYLISYRAHQGFHEDCCERIFTDILDQCAPHSLSVMCSFLRRGGIDINPIRSTPQCTPLSYMRTVRQ